MCFVGSAVWPVLLALPTPEETPSRKRKSSKCHEFVNGVRNPVINSEGRLQAIRRLKFDEAEVKATKSKEQFEKVCFPFLRRISLLQREVACIICFWHRDKVIPIRVECYFRCCRPEKRFYERKKSKPSSKLKK